MGKRPKEIIDNLRTGRLGSTFRLISKTSTKRPSNDLDDLVLITF
ncbi:hypothetical protein [Bacillus vallismortis]|nr:hypothetical protein [Bacillus vallismortis]